MEQTLSVGATAGVMRGMRGVVLGVANNRSIAWGIAKAAQAAGAELAFTFQGEALEKRVRPLAQELGAHVLGHCDVTEGGTIDSVFAEAGKLWEAVDFVVHCIAFSDKDQLTGRYIDTTEDNFTKSLAISCYSFTAIAQRAEKLMAMPWHGNVRELQNVVRRAFVLAGEGPLEPEHFGFSVGPPARENLSFSQRRARAIESFERLAVEDALRQCEGNITRAAGLVKKDRRAFGRLVKRYNLRPTSI